VTSLEVQPLQDDLPFGARIRGINRENLDDPAIRQQLVDVYEDRAVIVFEDVEPTSEMQVEISKVFGPLKDHPVARVERVDAEKYLGLVVTARTKPVRGAIVEIDGVELATYQPWHFDHSYNDELNRAGVLRAHLISPTRGLTGFIDGVQLYSDIDPAIRAEIEGEELLYSLDLRFSEQRYGLPKHFRVVQDKTSAAPDPSEPVPLAVHPAVWTRESGEKVLHVSPYGGRGIDGMGDEKADQLLMKLWAEVERVMKPYYHHWKPSDMVVWDNLRVLHQACGCDPDDDRVMYRTTIEGDYGLGRWQTLPDPQSSIEAPAM
jgi:taurine dioxygenase